MLDLDNKEKRYIYITKKRTNQTLKKNALIEKNNYTIKKIKNLIFPIEISPNKSK